MTEDSNFESVWNFQILSSTKFGKQNQTKKLVNSIRCFNGIERKESKRQLEMRPLKKFLARTTSTDRRPLEMSNRRHSVRWASQEVERFELMFHSWLWFRWFHWFEQFKWFLWNGMFKWNRIRIKWLGWYEFTNEITSHRTYESCKKPEDDLDTSEERN